MPASPPDSKLTIVVADDAAPLRALIRVTLELDGFRVVGEAGNGEEAIAVVAARQPDCVLLDLAMPVLDGLQAISEIRRVSPQTRIAVLSGFEANAMEARALALGADWYLDKTTALVDLAGELGRRLR